MFNIFKKKIPTYIDKINSIEKFSNTVSFYDLVYLSDFGNKELLLSNITLKDLVYQMNTISKQLDTDYIIERIKLSPVTIKIFCSDNGYINDNINNDVVNLLYVYKTLNQYYIENRIASTHSIFLKPYITIVSSVVDALYDELNI